MTDIFISTISDQLSSWSEAFPLAVLSSSVQQFSIDQDKDLVFWVHQNDGSIQGEQEDNRLKWLAAIVRHLLDQYPMAKVVVLSNQPNQTESLDAIRLGAFGYCHAYADVDTLQEIRSVIMRGGIWIGQEVLQRLIQETIKVVGNSKAQVDAILEKVTNREKQVALQVAKGLSNKEIARKLKITERTVKAHLAKVFETLAVKDRLQLALKLNKKK